MATNLVVKNAANVDKTFTLYSAAAGDGSVASWKLKEGLITQAFPQITESARVTGNLARAMTLKLRIPSSYTDANNLVVVGPAFEANLNVTVPDGFPEAMKDDSVAYLSNLVALAAVKAWVRDALPAQ